MVEIWPVSIFRIRINYLHPQSPKMVQNPLFSKIPKLVIFFSKVCVVGTLNLSQEMSDKMHNESTRGRLARNGPYSIKIGPIRPKMAQNGQFHKYLYAYGVGILNLSQEMSDEMHNESTRGRLAWNGPYSIKNGPIRLKNGPKWSIFKNTFMHMVWVL